MCDKERLLCLMLFICLLRRELRVERKKKMIFFSVFSVYSRNRRTTIIIYSGFPQTSHKIHVCIFDLNSFICYLFRNNVTNTSFESTESISVKINCYCLLKSKNDSGHKMTNLLSPICVTQAHRPESMAMADDNNE